MRLFFVLTSLFLSVPMALEGRRLLSPLLLRRGPLNKPYTDITIEEPWRINIWTGGYKRSADNGLDSDGCCTPLSTLFFNVPDFTAAQAFANNMPSSPVNVLTDIAILKPRIVYDEAGAVMGIDLQQCMSSCWRVGFRAVLPIRRIRMTRCPSDSQGGSDMGGMVLNDVLAEAQETINGATIQSYAYRLDVLTQLGRACPPCPQAETPLVIYADTNFPPNNPITIAGEDITNQQGTPVSALKNADGSTPPQPWAVTQAEAQQLPVINNQGCNVETRGRFVANNDYTPLGQNTANQRMLYIVPTVLDGETTEAARVIQTQVHELQACIQAEAEDIFKACGVSFESQRISGIGDLDTEFYSGYFPSACSYIEGCIGLRWPTGKKSTNPLLVFRPSIGNNGHFEFKLGTQGIYKNCRWAALRGDVTGFMVSKGREQVAASFAGATVKNIGPSVPATVSWTYMIAHIDLLITPPCLSAGGAVIGYENYYKSRDEICFHQARARDCFGNGAPLSSRPISDNTRMVSNKVRGELYYFITDKVQLFGGGSSIVSGKNIPKESGWYLGVSGYF